MKKSLLLLLGFVIQSAVSQNITFADEAFKNRLLLASESFAIAKDLNGNLTAVDINNDNEISVDEAVNISYLDLDYEVITSLSGIGFFTNLKFLRVQTIALAVFNEPTLTNLEELYLTSITNSGALTAFDVSNNTNLKVLHLYTSFLESVDLSQNINLRNLIVFSAAPTLLNLNNLVDLRTLIYIGNLNTIDLSDSTKLIDLTIGNANMTPGTYAFSSIDLSNQPLLANLSIGGTSITSLNLNNNQNLENVYINNNQIETLNFESLDFVKNLYCSNNQLSNLNVNNFQNLEVLVCDNNNLIGLSLKNFNAEDYINFSGNPNLIAICCDPEQEVYIQNQALLNGNYDAVVNSNCSNEGVLAVQDFDTLAIALYPNPTQDILNFNSESNITQLDIFDSNGRLVQSNAIGSGVKSINVSKLQSGVYLVKAFSAAATFNTKMIKR